MTAPDERWLDSADRFDEQADGGAYDELGQLVIALRQPASSEELDGQEPIIAAMQVALVQSTSTPRVGRRGRQLGRIAVVKGTVAVGALAFGVAAAAATTGMVEIPRLPGWPREPAPAEAPAPPASIGSSRGTDGSSATGGAADDADGGTGSTPETETSHPGSGPRTSVTPSSATSTPTSTAAPTTEPTTTVPPSDADAVGPGKANPPPPPVSLPPPAQAGQHGPPGDGDLPACAHGSAAGEAASESAAAREPPCAAQP